MVTLLRLIQEAATIANPDPVLILRRCLVLAARLQHRPLKEWTEQELNGYRSRDVLPAYRVVDTQSYGNFRNSWGEGLKNVPIPTSLLPEKVQDMASHIYLMDGVGAYIDMLVRRPEASLHDAWPTDAVHWVAPQLDLVSGNATLQEAWRVLDMSAVAHLVASVVNRALDFSLAIEAENPEAGEALPSEPPPVPLDRVNHIYNQTIFVNGQHNVSVASTGVRQSISHSVQPGDLASLIQVLTDLGVEREDVASLEQAIEGDSRSGQTRGVGPRVASWFGGLGTKAAEQAATQVGASTAGALGARLPEIIQALQNFSP